MRMVNRGTVRRRMRREEELVSGEERTKRPKEEGRFDSLVQQDRATQKQSTPKF